MSLLEATAGLPTVRRGARWVVEQATHQPGTDWLIVAPDLAAARRVCIEGDDGVLSLLSYRAVGTYQLAAATLRLTNGSRIRWHGVRQVERWSRGRLIHGAWLHNLRQVDEEALRWALARSAATVDGGLQLLSTAAT